MKDPAPPSRGVSISLSLVSEEMAVEAEGFGHREKYETDDGQKVEVFVPELQELEPDPEN